MAACPFFSHLIARVQVLEQKFLTGQLTAELADPLSFTPDTDLLAAYRLLVHAEIEDFLERKGRADLESMARALASQKPIIPTVWVYQLANHFAMTLPHDCPFDDHRFRLAVDAVIKRARETLADNNGIKTAIYLVVCLIDGYRIDEIDHALATALSAFGEARGDVAHKSTNRVTSIRAPSAEKKDVDDIMKALEQFFFPLHVQANVASAAGTALVAPAVAVAAPATAAPAAELAMPTPAGTVIPQPTQPT
ncbi:hypothetical protein C798_19405 [Herbaspirillum rubrisubalbicans Os34]|uniref:Uncharacterized protein n=1 Tax=Herbaspirillum rubrisubalbicans Os34 TaxID=1235827 RepID=A0A6M3ZUK4_9BURK|nr:hypothetical protein [Herbaspirillum rubrisubalbicans]QJQ02325.1 hypothetical protein C798_19405 [Herbaspirillum rubrisubalbicans Os34]